jgi:hypothetical protein
MEQAYATGERSPDSPLYRFRLLLEPPHHPGYAIPGTLRSSLDEASGYDRWLAYLADSEAADQKRELEEHVKWRIGRLSLYFAELVRALPDQRSVLDYRRLWMRSRTRTVIDGDAVIRLNHIRNDLLFRPAFPPGHIERIEHEAGFITKRPLEIDLKLMTPEGRADTVRTNVHGAMKYVSGLYDGMLWMPDRVTGNRIFPFRGREEK